MVCPEIFADYSLLVYTPQPEADEVSGFLGL